MASRLLDDCAVPQVHGTVVRFDSKSPKPQYLELVEGSATYAVACQARYINVSIEGMKGPQLMLKDNLLTAKREWTEAIPGKVKNVVTLRQACVPHWAHLSLRATFLISFRKLTLL